MKSIYFVLCVLFLTFTVCASYNILVVFPLPSKSHCILGDGYVNTLLEGGHQVTYLTGCSNDMKHRNLRVYDVSTEVSRKTLKSFDIKLIMDKKLNLNDVNTINSIMQMVAVITIEHEQVQALMNDPKEKFDIGIFEWMFSELYSGLSVVFDCPFIWSSSMDPHVAILKLIDEAPNPAYTPGLMSMNSLPFTFIQRVQELWKQIELIGISVTRSEAEQYERLYGPVMLKKGRPLPPLDVVKYNASLVLGNSHVITGVPVSLPQSYKPIGGYHVNPNPEPLTEELKNIMDEAQHGVIFFSMGSNLKSTQMTSEMKSSLVKMFGRLKQTVLWKFEEKISDIPPNLHTVQWAPQQSILAHPNCKLFITHGGILSVAETLYYGVPIIGVPAFADQFMNIKKAESRGYARKVSLTNELATDMETAIQEVLSNSKYSDKAKELSRIYHDQLVSPRQELLHWVEYVVRTCGASHLRSPALMTPWYQKVYLDLVVLLISIVFIIKLLLTCLLRSLCGSSNIDNTRNIKRKKM